MLQPARKELVNTTTNISQIQTNKQPTTITKTSNDQKRITQPVKIFEFHTSSNLPFKPHVRNRKRKQPVKYRHLSAPTQSDNAAEEALMPH
jgi:hypothetical protein